MIRAALVIAGGVCIHLTFGTLYTFGNLSPYLTSYLRNRTSETDLTYGDSVWIFSVAVMGQGCTMYFGGMLARYIGPRLTVLCGACFQSFGILLTYMSVQHSFPVTVITYGLMAGFGVGVAYAAPMALGMRWLPKRKGLVNGCVVAGFGGGAFIFNQIQTAYINPENQSPDQSVDGEQFFTQPDILDKVPTLFLILGGSYVCLQVLGVLLLANPPAKVGEAGQATGQESLPAPESAKAPSTDVTIEVSAEEPIDREVSPKQLFTFRGFYILWIVFLLNGLLMSFTSSLYKAYGQTFISDDVFLTGVGTFAAVCNAAGRILWGLLADKTSFKVSMLCLCSIFTILMMTLTYSSQAGRWMFLIWVGLLFLTFSGTFTLVPTAIARSFGQIHYAKNYGIIFTSQVISTPITPMLTTSLKSAIGWVGMFYLIAAFSFTSLLLTLAFNIKMPNGKSV